MATHHGKYLTFRLAREHYGVPILQVQEIIGLQDITRVPRTPPFVRGVVNLRGRVIPVTDLRLKFGLEQAEPTDRTCIVVVRVAREEGTTTQIGVIVDEVLEVVNVGPAEFVPPPSLGPDVHTEFLLGLAKLKDVVVILVDIDRVLSTREIVEISGLAQQPAGA